MNQQPDKLFREKLEGYQKPAPASAWEKIAAAQAKKNNKGGWLKIAASLALLAVAGYILWFVSNTNAPQDSITNATKEPVHTSVPQDNSPKSEIAENKNDKLPVPKSQPTGKRKLPKKERIKTKQTQNVAVAEETNLNDQSLQTTTLVARETEPTTIQEPSIAESQVTEKPADQNVTMVFTAADVDGYLDKTALAEATSEEKKSSTLKKLLKKANDLTSNQDPFGELRQKKNEILALNFRSEKQRGQNK